MYNIHVHGVILLALIILWINLLIHRISFDIWKIPIPHRPPDLGNTKTPGSATADLFMNVIELILHSG